MSNWEKNVRKVVPYVPGEQPHEADMIKLNTNENPYPPSPKAAEAIRRVAEEDTLRLYPDPTAAELVQAIADVYHVSPKQVFVGVGSDDVQIRNHLLISDCIADAHAGKRTGF